MVHINKIHYVFEYKKRTVRLSTRMYQILKIIYGDNYVPLDDVVKKIYGVSRPNGVRVFDHNETCSVYSIMNNLRRRVGGKVVESVRHRGYRTSKKFNEEVDLKDIVEEDLDTPRESEKEKTSVIHKLSSNQEFIEVKKVVSREMVEDWILEGNGYKEIQSKLTDMKLIRSNIEIFKNEKVPINELPYWNLSTLSRFLEYLKIKKKDEYIYDVYSRCHYRKYKKVIQGILKKVKTYRDLYKELDKKKVPVVRTRIVKNRVGVKGVIRNSITKWLDHNKEFGSSNKKIQKYLKVNGSKWKPIVSKPLSKLTEKELESVRRLKLKRFKEHYEKYKEVMEKLLKSESRDIEMSLKLDELKIPLVKGNTHEKTKTWTKVYSRVHNKNGKMYSHYDSSQLRRYLVLLKIKTKDGFLRTERKGGKFSR